MSRARTKARRCAVQALYQMQVGQQSLAETLATFADDWGLRGGDGDYFKTLVSEVDAEASAIDEQLAPLMDRPGDQLDLVTRIILRIAACELARHWEVPYRVVVNEAVELAKYFGGEQSYRFVNATVDRLAAQLRAMEKNAR